jgi:hypothetical protein
MTHARNLELLKRIEIGGRLTSMVGEDPIKFYKESQFYKP